MKTIENITNELLIVEKSKFFSFLHPINNKEEANEIVNNYKKKYHDANHVCYGYILNESGFTISKSNDDGEPASTAGQPILNALKNNNLENVLCVVVRYFGGIKLGASNLSKTYQEAAKMALNKANIIELKKIDVYKIEFNYDLITLIDRFINSINCIVVNKIYDIKVNYEIAFINNEELDKIKDKFNINIEVSFLYNKQFKI